MRWVIATALTVALSAAEDAKAQAPDGATSDLACMVVTMLAATRTTDANSKQGVMVGFGYYMGRLKGRDPGIDLKARLLAETRALVANPDRLKAEAIRCGADMQAWGRETKEIGEALTAEGRKIQGDPAT